jgi:hypothetical protein
VVFFVIYTPGETQVVPEQFSDVQKYVDTCVEQTLLTAYKNKVSETFPDYATLEGSIADEIKSTLVYCSNFTEDFPDLEIKPRDVVSVVVNFNSDNSMVSTTVIYPIVVSKGDYIKTLDRFYAEITLMRETCIPIKVNDRVNCQAAEEKTVRIDLGNGIQTVIYHMGDDVKIYGGDAAYCPAC